MHLPTWIPSKNWRRFTILTLQVLRKRNMDDTLWEAEQQVQRVGRNLVGRVEKSSPRPQEARRATQVCTQDRQSHRAITGAPKPVTRTPGIAVLVQPLGPCDPTCQG